MRQSRGWGGIGRYKSFAKGQIVKSHAILTPVVIKFIHFSRFLSVIICTIHISPLDPTRFFYKFTSQPMEYAARGLPILLIYTLP